NHPSLESFVVEFFGLAGVGKTAMAQALMGMLRKQGILVRPLSRLPIAHCRKVQPKALIRANRIVAGSRPKQADALPAFVGLYKDLVKLAEGHRRGGLWISDQGLCQRVATLHKYGAPGWSSTWISQSHGRRYPPDLVVLVYASRDRVHSRRCS